MEAARAWFGTVQVVERLQRYLKRQRLSDKKTHAHNYFVEELLGFAHRNPPSLYYPTRLPVGCGVVGEAHSLFSLTAVGDRKAAVTVGGWR